MHICISYNTGKSAKLGMGDMSTEISIPILKVLDTWVSSNFLKESKFPYL